MEIEPVTAASRQANQGGPSSSGNTTSNPTPPSSDNLMWIEKYRPTTLKDLLSHHDIVTTLNTLISSNRLPHLLFCGPPGTGKTSTILACAKQMYGPSYKSMVLELNASDDRGINVVRDQIKSFASTRRIFSTGVKLIVLDEADAMTSAAQMALRRVVEKFAANTRFCIICNYVNRIIPALQSRCTKFRFGPLPSDDVRKRVEQIAHTEKVNLKPDGLTALLHVGKGDMRRILNVLQSSHMACTASGQESVGEDEIYANTGAPHPADIIMVWKWLQDDDLQTCYSKVQSLKISKGLALSDIMSELLIHIRQSEFATKAKMYVYEQWADIEQRLSVGASEKMNTMALIASCRVASSLSIDAMVV